MTSLRLLDLPDEVIQNVLFRLDYTNALALEVTCRRFRDVANEPLLWKSFCRHGWKKWHPRHQFQARLAGGEFTSWKALFAERTRSHRLVRTLIDKIVDEDLDRIARVERVVELAWDAKDALVEAFRLAHLSEENVLAQRWWSQEVLGCLHRAMALEVWTNLHYESLDENPYERSLGALDLFVLTASRPGDIEDIFAKLDFYVRCVRQDHPGVDELSPREKAALVARYLLARGWTGMRDDRDYHNVEHNFLGVALYGEGHNSLPLVTVVIYCYVVRALGLRAEPCSFPMHVHALVRPPAGLDLDGNPLPLAAAADPAEGDPAPASMMYMDPFRSDEEVPLATLKDQIRIFSHQFTDAEVRGFLLESDARSITVRCARNIFNSQQSVQPPLEDVDKYNAMYGAAWASILVPHSQHTETGGTTTTTAPAPIRRHHPDDLTLLMQAFFENSTLDVGLVERHILPLCVDLRASTQYAKECRALRARDAAPKHNPNRHRDGSSSGNNVRYRVGQVFRHRRYDYVAAIKGWDPQCSSGEIWIRQMGVDRLPRGRGQPFYHVLGIDASTRYVAEENIELLSSATFGADDAARFPLEAGKYFKRWDDREGVFVSNIRAEYPED